MREIKFRAWDLYNNKMILLGDLETISLHKDYDFANYKVMQYTGLCDKNGVEIYEEYKISGYYFDYNINTEEVKVIGFVKSSNGVFELVWNKGSHLPLYKINNREVIGNIYETKE